MHRALASALAAAALFAALPASADLVLRTPSPCRDLAAGDACTEEDKQGTCKEEHSRLKNKSYLVCDTSLKPATTATPATSSTPAPPTSVEPMPSSEPVASTTEPAAPTPLPSPSPATSEPPPAVPSTQRGCSCDVVGAGGHLGWGLGLGAAGFAIAVWVGRRAKRDDEG